MGNQQSSTTIINDTVNKAATNVLMNSSSECSQNNSLSQIQVFKNISGAKGCSPNFSSDQSAQQSPNFTCASDSKNESDLLTKFENELTQQAEAQAKNFVVGNAETRASTSNKIVNDVLTNINISNLSTCIQDNMATQSQSLEGIEYGCPAYCGNPELCRVFLEFGHPELCDQDKCIVHVADLAQAAVQSAVGNCLSKNTNLQKAINDNAITTTQVSNSKNTGVDVAEIVSSFTGPIIAIGVVVVIMLMIAAYFLLQGGGTKQMQAFRQMQMPANQPLAWEPAVIAPTPVVQSPTPVAQVQPPPYISMEVPQVQPRRPPPPVPPRNFIQENILANGHPATSYSTGLKRSGGYQNLSSI